VLAAVVFPAFVVFVGEAVVGEAVVGEAIVGEAVVGEVDGGLKVDDEIPPP